MSRKNCLHCGANPVPHLGTWVEQSLDVASAPLSRHVFDSWLGRLAGGLIDVGSPLAIKALRAVGIIRFDGDISGVSCNRGKVLWEEAQRRGIAMESLKMLGRTVDAYRARLNGKELFFASLPRPRRSDSQYWMDDKMILKQKLEERGIPVPRGRSFSKTKPALEYFRILEKPVIIKPRVGSRGRHTTTFIRTEEEAEKAFRIGKQLCHWVIMEEHLVGSVYRATMIDGKAAGILAGDPPRITGDGRSAIEDLIARKNASKPEGVKDFVITPVVIDFLRRNGQSLSTVLPEGETIDLLEKIGVSYGGSSAEVTEQTHPETIQILEQAAAVVDDPLIGFDFIIEDIARSPREQKWGIIECNSVPFINLHYDPIVGRTNNVAARVWDMMEAETAGRNPAANMLQ